MTQNKARRTNKIDFLQLPWAQEVPSSNLGAPTRMALHCDTLRVFRIFDPTLFLVARKGPRVFTHAQMPAGGGRLRLRQTVVAAFRL